MKQLIALIFLFLSLTMTSCELVGDIFSAGFYTGLFVVVLLIAVIVYVIFKMRRR